MLDPRHRTMKTGLYLILFLNVGLVYGDGPAWGDPPLECLPKSEWHESMTSCNYSPEFKIMDVKVNENAKGDVIIAYINCESCSADNSVHLGQFTQGNNAILGAKLAQEVGKWLLKITKEQDYESPDQRAYIFDIYIDQEATYQIALKINDLDDNAPIIKVNQKTCSVMENLAGLSNCTYQIYDPDTVSKIMQTKIYFDDTEMDYVNDLFKIQLNSVADDDKSAVGTLDVITALDYENISIYMMTMYAEDIGGNKGQASVTVEVGDDNDMPPRWVQIFATQTFPEEEPQEFKVLAVDGDVKIKAVINYKFETECHKDITIDKETGEIHVDKIDRDVLENDFITCLLIAYERDTPTMEVNATITFLILDINDNDPVITPKNFVQVFPENKYLTLEQVININDIDLGINATYTVELQDVGDKNLNWYKAFQVIPSSAYKTWNFSINVIDPGNLDYEDKNWREFTIKIVSKDPDRSDESTINIKLTNRNDEVPVFTKDIYKVGIKENATAGSLIETIQAIDKDCDDHVVYGLAGDYLNDLFVINEISGKITTRKDDVFDFEKQREVIIPVQAHDTLIVDNEPTHNIFAQVQVTVIDVNDEKPRISLPTEAVTVDENEKVGHLLTNKITATDPDTKANLLFDIDWENTIASLQGSPVLQKDFENVFKIVTKFEDPIKRGYAYAELIVDKREKLDYETFNVIYLHVIVEDKGQEINNGTDSATLTVTIKDMNDNPPVFDDNTITSKKSVEEKSNKDLLIGTIVATDRDGPLNNQVKYKLKATGDTPDGLIDIGLINGELRVTSDTINADEPRWNLTYTVTATDGTFHVPKDITIIIEDKNDQIPVLQEEGFEKVIIVDEGKTNLFLQKIKASDADRDKPHNVVSYYLNPMGNPDLMYLFNINNETGDAFVDVDTSKGYVLDRDNGDKYYDIYLTLRDNVGYSGISNVAVNYSFRVQLNDINNKIPKLPNMKINDISENTNAGKELARIRAIDEDELGNVNTKIEYSITKVTNDLDEIVTDEIFRIDTEPVEQYYYDGVLKTNKELKTYYGKFNIFIHTKDFGEPEQHDDKNYPIEIIPYNYENPTILFPKDNKKIILQKDQQIGQRLWTVDGKILDQFHATDNQKEKYAMKFELLKTENDDNAIFELRQHDNSKAELILKSEVKDQEKIYNLKLKAYHNGIGSNALNFAEIKFSVLFIDPEENPKFEDGDEAMIEFLENHIECKTFPKATDHKCLNNANCVFPLYYHIISEVDAFEIDEKDIGVPKICVKNPLDRETIEYYYLDIVATNNEKPPTSVGKLYPLNLTVKVLDENDNPPKFSKSLFSGSMTASDTSDRTIVTLEATDPDSSDEGKLTYYIERDTINVSDSSLNNYKNNPFKIWGTNKIRSTFIPVNGMKGFFIFKVRVDDSLGGTDHEAFSFVKIYIISEDNRVAFTFKNQVAQVSQEHDYIEQVFTEELAYNCTIDKIDKKKAEDSGQVMENETVVQTHFINEEENEPVEKDVILQKSTSPEILATLRAKFLLRKLNFSDIPRTNDETENKEGLLRTLLIIVSVVLGTLSIVLFIAFVIRTRSWNKRLNALTTNVFGSTKSDLNRLGTNVPGTNKHAIEANPVWNEDLNNVTQFDTISQGSGGSDLIGIEDNPEFQYAPDDRRSSINPTIQDVRRRSLNPMAANGDVEDLNNFRSHFGNKSNMMF